MRIVLSLIWVLMVPVLASPLELEEVPQDRIYDPGEMLTEDYRESIARRIKHEFINAHLEVFVLLFPEEPQESASAVSQAFGNQWAKTAYWAVIYQVGFEGEPMSVAGGALMKRLNSQVIENGINAASSAGQMVDGRQSRLEEYVNALTNQFGYLKVVAMKAQNKAYEEYRKNLIEKSRKRKRMLLMGALGALGFLAAGVLALAYQKRGQRKSKKSVTFPDFEPRVRLAGPHTGGSSVLVHFGTNSHSG